MPLVLDLKAGERIIINGAVLEAGSPHTKIVVHNRVAVLRGKEILSEEESETPAGRVYFALQNAYLFPDHAQGYIDKFRVHIAQYLEACPSAAEIGKVVSAEVDEGRHYQALKEAQQLIFHQNDTLKQFEEKMVEMTEEGDQGPAEEHPSGTPSVSAESPETGP